MLGDGPRVFADFVLEIFYGSFELRVAAGEGGMWEIVDDRVRIDAVTFDEPLAVGTIDAHFCRVGDAAVREVRYPLAVATDDLKQKFGGIEGLPTTMLFDREGLLRQKMIGFEYMETIEKDLKPLLCLASSRLVL